MITEALIAVFNAVAGGIYSLLPDWNLNPLMSGSHEPVGGITNAGGYGSGGDSPITNLLYLMKSWNNWLPVDQVVLIFNGMVAYAIAYQAMKWAKWIIGIVRGAGTE